MNDPKDPDRDILGPRQALWANEPDQTLTEEELDRLVALFGVFENAAERDLQSALNGLFQQFLVMATDERFREHDGYLKKVPKPSTIIEGQMEQLSKICEKLDGQLAGLDQATKAWLDLHLEERGVKSESGQRVRRRHLVEQINWLTDLLIHASHSAEGLASPGPNNAALRFMIDNLAWHWGICHGKLPTRGEVGKAIRFWSSARRWRASDTISSRPKVAALAPCNSAGSFLKYSESDVPARPKCRGRSSPRDWRKLLRRKVILFLSRMVCVCETQRLPTCKT